MPLATVSILKFVGTVSLGLLTGISYTTSTQSIPALLSLPSASTALNSFNQHTTSTQRHLSAFFVASITSYTLAFTLSPRRAGRHPYLLWTSLVAAIGYGSAQYLVLQNEARLRESMAADAAKAQDEDSYVDAAGSGSTSDLSAPAEYNGEEVRKAMESWRVAEMVRAGFSGLAFFMAVVGIWGDGLAVRNAAVVAIAK